MVAKKKLSAVMIAVLGSLFTFYPLIRPAHADGKASTGVGDIISNDDKPFLRFLGGSVYSDDRNFLGVISESVDISNKSLLDFPGGPAYSGDKTFLGFDGDLVNKNTGRTIPNAIVSLFGPGLPPQTHSDHSGNFRASSTSPSEYIRVTIQVNGYQPYSVLVFRCEKAMVYYRNLKRVFRLTPVFPLPPVQSGIRFPSH